MLSELLRDTEDQPKPVLIATLGLGKLEDSHRGSGVYRGLTKLIKGQPKGKVLPPREPSAQLPTASQLRQPGAVPRFSGYA